MTTNYQTQRVTVPTVFVTRGRQRVKQYDNKTVYLKNGDEFELELFNSIQNKVLAKINLNGKSFDSGIIIRPGERVFLERYLNEAKKFLFETYEVDGNDAAAVEAVRLNGYIEVEFYEEYKPYPYWPPYPYYHYTYWQSPYEPPYTYYSSDTGDSPQITYGYGSAIGTSAVMSSGTCSCSANAIKDFTPVETGRVEKGSNSNQDFTYDSTTFNSYCTWRTIWKILPESQRPLMAEDLKIYCVNCGSKRKKSSHIFCPTCGEKFN